MDNVKSLDLQDKERCRTDTGAHTLEMHTQGYYNGFGGKVEPGETVEDGAHRELTEESCITAHDMALAGVLTFVFDDNPQPWEVHGKQTLRVLGSFRAQCMLCDSHRTCMVDILWILDTSSSKAVQSPRCAWKYRAMLPLMLP